MKSPVALALLGLTALTTTTMAQPAGVVPEAVTVTTFSTAFVTATATAAGTGVPYPVLSGTGTGGVALPSGTGAIKHYYGPGAGAAWPTNHHWAKPTESATPKLKRWFW